MRCCPLLVLASFLCRLVSILMRRTAMSYKNDMTSHHVFQSSLFQPLSLEPCTDWSIGNVLANQCIVEMFSSHIRAYAFPNGSCGYKV